MKPCVESAIERSGRMCSARNEVVAHMETAPSSEPHPDPRAWAKRIEALPDDDVQVRLATATES
jgi:hypothetical protein